MDEKDFERIEAAAKKAEEYIKQSCSIKSPSTSFKNIDTSKCNVDEMSKF